MTELSEIGTLSRSRRGVAIATLLFWMIIAAAGGAVAWDLYGNEVRARLGIVRDGEPRASSNELPAAMPANDEIAALVKDLQTSQKRTADQLETVLQLLSSEQASSRTTADAVAALSAKVDALQHPAVTAAKRPAPVPAAAPTVPRRPPAAPRPLAPNPEPDQPEAAPGAPSSTRP